MGSASVWILVSLQAASRGSPALRLFLADSQHLVIGRLNSGHQRTAFEVHANLSRRVRVFQQHFQLSSKLLPFYKSERGRRDCSTAGAAADP